MKAPEDVAREKKFLELARSAQMEVFENEGDCPPARILTLVVSADERLWIDMQPQLAERGALFLIKSLITRTLHVIDHGIQLDLFPNMPRLITFKKEKINLLKAAAQLDWYGDWWGRRLYGLAKRTEEDLAISGEIERLKRVV